MSEPQSKDFLPLELRCRCPKCDRKKPNQVNRKALALLQSIRDEFGDAMVVTSAYRCPDHPIEASKKEPGEHAEGLAFDILVPWGRDRMRLIEIALRNECTRFGFADSYVHLGFRESPLTSWTY